MVSSAKAITRSGMGTPPVEIIKGSGVFSNDFNKGSRKSVHFRGAMTLPCPSPHFFVHGSPAPYAVRTTPSRSLSKLSRRVDSSGGNL